MGGAGWGEPDDEQSIRTIHKSLDLGINFFDTAFVYGRGHSEEVLGRGLAGRRDEAVISTKASLDLSPESVTKQVEGSLTRLKTDYLDVLFIHWPSRKQPLARTLEAMEKLRERGVVRVLGASNFDVPLLEMASRYATISIVQPPYNLIWRFMEEDVLPHAKQKGIGVCTYSSLAQGLLTGTLRLNLRYDRADIRPLSVLWRPENFGKCLYTVERLRPIAADLGVSVAQLSLRWLISRPGVTTALVGAIKESEITENTTLFDWDFSDETALKVQEISDELYLSMPYYYDMWGNWSNVYRRGVQRET
jgi:aryl-alcohol dehydrogenase-like predicted oxidoreductase